MIMSMMMMVMMMMVMIVVYLPPLLNTYPFFSPPTLPGRPKGAALSNLGKTGGVAWRVALWCGSEAVPGGCVHAGVQVIARGWLSWWVGWETSRRVSGASHQSVVCRLNTRPPPHPNNAVVTTDPMARHSQQRILRGGAHGNDP